MTDAVLSYLGADDLLTALLGRVKEILDADTVAVLLLDSSGRQLIATAASGLEEEVGQGVRIPVGGGFAGRIAAERAAGHPGPRRSQQCAQPDSAGEGNPVPGGRAAARPRRGDRGAARRHGAAAGPAG